MHIHYICYKWIAFSSSLFSFCILLHPYSPSIFTFQHTVWHTYIHTHTRAHPTNIHSPFLTHTHTTHTHTHTFHTLTLPPPLPPTPHTGQCWRSDRWGWQIQLNYVKPKFILANAKIAKKCKKKRCKSLMFQQSKKKLLFSSRIRLKLLQFQVFICRCSDLNLNEILFILSDRLDFVTN
jgi:hypothetical protein